MKALLYTFPSILKSTLFAVSLPSYANVSIVPSEKGKSIRNTREELGKVAMQMWNEAKASNNDDGKTLMSLMSMFPAFLASRSPC